MIANQNIMNVSSIITKISAVFWIRVVGLILSMISLAVLARFLGPADLGYYAFALSIASTISIPLSLGLPILIVREISWAVKMEDWPRLRGIAIWATWLIAVSGVLIIGISGLVFWNLYDKIPAEKAQIIALSFLLVPIMAFTQARVAILRGLKHFASSQASEQLVKPIGLTALLCVLYFYTEGQVSGVMAMVCLILSWLLSFFIGAIVLRKAWPPQATGINFKMQHKNWLSTIFPLSLVGGINLINSNADIFMLEYFTSSEEVGVYRIASTVATLAGFGFVTIRTVVQPYYSEYFAKSEHSKIRYLLNFSALFGMSFSLAFLLFFYFFGEKVLEISFGLSYISAYLSIIIISIGQTIFCFWGASGALLNMTGGEKRFLIGVFFGTVANISLNFSLIPNYGIEGAAFATAFSLAVTGACMGISARKHLPEH